MKIVNFLVPKSIPFENPSPELEDQTTLNDISLLERFNRLDFN